MESVNLAKGNYYQVKEASKNRMLDLVEQELSTLDSGRKDVIEHCMNNMPRFDQNVVTSYFDDFQVGDYIAATNQGKIICCKVLGSEVISYKAWIDSDENPSLFEEKSEGCSIDDVSFRYQVEVMNKVNFIWDENLRLQIKE
jgi:hypothetical protein